MTSIKNILTAIFVFGIFALHPSLNKGENPITYLHYFVYGNDFNLSYNQNINREKVLVKWICEDDNANCKELVIFKKGEKINSIPFEQGNQALFIYYSNKLVGTLSQNKLSKSQSHQYNVKLTAKENLITLKAEVIGPSANTVSESISITDFILAKQ